MDLPYLLAIQLDSYKNFTQADVAPEDRKNTGLHMPRLIRFSRLLATLVHAALVC